MQLQRQLQSGLPSLCRTAEVLLGLELQIRQYCGDDGEMEEAQDEERSKSGPCAPVLAVPWTDSDGIADPSGCRHWLDGWDRVTA